jgi:putative copper export protein
MEFMIWAARSMHVFSAVVWLGGLLYMGGIFYPVIRYEEMTASPVYIRIERRFTGFVWMCVWTTAITGVFLMLFSPRFVFDRYHDEWDFLLLVKEIIYVLMVGTAVAGTSVVKEMESIAASPSTDETKHELAIQHQKMLRGRRTSLALGIITLLVAVRMVMV